MSERMNRKKISMDEQKKKPLKTAVKIVPTFADKR